MFDQADTSLEAWTKGALDGVEVSLSPPTDSAEQNTVSLYLMDVTITPPARGMRLPPVRATLRYLITAQSADPKEAHRLLGEIMVAAAENPEFEMEQEPVSVETWRSFGLHPRPALLLKMPFTHERVERPVKTVRFPLKAKQTALTRLHGKLISTEGIPLVGARVELPFFKLNTVTDLNGVFRFPSVPSEPKNNDLSIRVKGREFSISTKQAKSESGLLVFKLAMEENNGN